MDRLLNQNYNYFGFIAAMLAVMLIAAIQISAATPAMASCEPRVEYHTTDNPDQPDPPPAQSLSPTTGGEEPVTVYYDSVTNLSCNP